MKRDSIIKLSIVFYILLAGLVILGAKYYVDKKEDRLWSEAINNLDDFFSEQSKFVNVDYSGKSIKYEKASIPKYNALDRQFSWNSYEDKELWDEHWGDVSKLYKLIERWPSDNEWTGWQFSVIEKDNTYDGFSLYIIYPYEVAIKKQSESWMYSYIPSVQTAIDESFEFHTENDLSDYKNYLTGDNPIHTWDVAKKVDNDYFIAFSYDKYRRILGKEKIDSIIYNNASKVMCKREFSWRPIEDRETRYYGGMHNGYYKVNNRIHPIEHYVLRYNIFQDPKRDDFNKITFYGECVLFLIFIFIIVTLCITNRRYKKEINENIKEKLLRLCNPQRFLKPYNEEKISIANDLYERIINTPDSNTSELILLRKEAASSLGINFINEELLNNLIKITNPQKYMKPYDAEKVRIANALHTRLINKDLTIDEFEDIQREIKDKLI